MRNRYRKTLLDSVLEWIGVLLHPVGWLMIIGCGLGFVAYMGMGVLWALQVPVENYLPSFGQFMMLIAGFFFGLLIVAVTED